MRTIRNISLSVITAFSLLNTSCLNLESEIYDVINPTIFPQTEQDAYALVNACYLPFRSNWYGGIFTVASGGIQIIGDMSTDLGQCQWGENSWGPALYHNWDANEPYVGRFYEYTRDIGKFTITIDRISKIEMNAEKKARLTAELRAARGWMLYMLYNWYGPVPVATLEELNTPLADKAIPRPTKEWTVNFIEEDLIEAAKVLPAKYTETDYGRFTKGLVKTVLMKLYMHEGEWAKAESVGRELLNPEYGYGLMSDYASIFKLENEGNKEIIFAATCDSKNAQLWLAHVLPSEYPTQNTAIQKWNGYRVPWNFYHTFEAKDKRLEVLVGEFKGNDGVLYNESTKDTHVALRKGALPVKYGEDPSATGEESQVDWIVLRYADVVTLLAEAIARNAGGATQEAVDLLNQVRLRAGLEALTLADVSSLQDFLDSILLERGHEFWFEGIRREDLIRHGKYIQYAREYKGSTTTREECVLMPIPQWAINEGKGEVIQNPGY